MKEKIKHPDGKTRHNTTKKEKHRGRKKITRKKESTGANRLRGGEAGEKLDRWVVCYG